MHDDICRTLAAMLALTAIGASQDRAVPDPLQTLLDRCLQQLRSAPAVAGERSERIEAPGQKAEPADPVPFTVQRQGCWSRGMPEYETRSDGHVMWTIQRLRHRYIKQDDFWTHDFGRHLLAGFEAALDKDSAVPKDLSLARAEYDGRQCLAARFTLAAGFDRTLYFDLASSWPAGYEQTQKDGTHVSVAYGKVRVEKARPAADFAWKPEPDFVEIDLKRHEPMPVGAVVPDVTLAVQGGGKTRLGELLKDKKALLLDFWFVDCVPCRHAMPVVEQVAKDLEAQGLALAGVDFGDPEERIARFLAEQQRSLRVLRNGTGTDDLVHVLEVPSFPCLFLLGPDRKVLWREAGFDQKQLETALRAAGFELPQKR